MSNKRKCLWCGEEFHPHRSNHTHCIPKCRNAKNNKAYTEKIAPFKQISDGLQALEEKLAKLYLLDDDGVYFEEEHFEKSGIKTSLSRQMYFDENNDLIRFEFLYYALVKTNDNKFKLIKL
jgi:hypothetical protein